MSDQSGTRELYIEAFPGPGARVQVSSSGGTEPVWHANGRELFYRTTTMLMSASLAMAPELSVVRWDSLFVIELPEPTQVSNYDVMPDGNHSLRSGHARRARRRWPSSTGPPSFGSGWRRLDEATTTASDAGKG